MGGSGGKSGFFGSTGGWLVNPLQKAFGDAGLAISNPVGFIMDKAGYGWADPIGAATTGYVRATDEGKAQLQDLYNPLWFGQGAEDRMAQAQQNQQAWDDYYKSVADNARKRIVDQYGQSAVAQPGSSTGSVNPGFGYGVFAAPRSADRARRLAADTGDRASVLVGDDENDNKSLLTG